MTSAAVSVVAQGDAPVLGSVPSGGVDGVDATVASSARTTSAVRGSDVVVASVAVDDVGSVAPGSVVVEGVSVTPCLVPADGGVDVVVVGLLLIVLGDGVLT